MLEAEVITSEAVGGEMLPAVIPQQKYAGIAILGSHPATVMQSPFGDPSWLIYACSPHNVENRTLPRVDQWFEVHDPIEDPTRAFGYLKAVSEMPFVWMRDKRALASGLFKGAREYPEAALKGTSTVEKLKIANPDGTSSIRMAEVPKADGLFCPYMFTSSIAYMLAKAIVDIEAMIQNGQASGDGNPPMIGMWGILQASENEYVYQRPGIQYFITEAWRRGIKVIANRESCLFDMPQWKW
jgi:hypothetical protein